MAMQLITAVTSMTSMRFIKGLCVLLATLALSCSREEPLSSESSAQSCDAAPVSIQASLPSPGDTKTDFQMNDEGTYAQMLWSSGDTFLMLADSPDRYWITDYTTTDSGTPSATFTTTYLITNPVDYCWSLYPAFDYLDLYLFDTDRGEVTVTVINLPTVQQATPGKPDPATHRMYAYSKTPTQDLAFKNATALVKFRLPADVASNLASIKLKADAYIAGDAAFYDLDKEEPSFAAIGGQLVEPTSKEVTLNGPFQGDTDYYIATYPRTLDRLSIIFTDKEGRTSGLLSKKEVELRRSRILDLGCLRVPTPGNDPDVITWKTGKPGKAPTLCVLGDGFTASEQDLLISRAKSAMEYLFETEPYKSWKDYFNVYLIKTVSNESGASVTDGHGNIIKKVDTAFDMAYADIYSTGETDMHCNTGRARLYAATKCPAILSGNISINDLTIFLLINDTRYGGLCTTYGYGGSVAMIPYIDNGAPYGWGYPAQEAASATATEPDTHTVSQEEINEIGVNVGDWRNVVLHEGGGHGFGRLADEYWYGPNTLYGSIQVQTWPVPADLNVTTDISASSTSFLWKDFINNPTLLEKDSRYGRIGTFQGGYGYMFGCWRSERISCMIDNRPYFSFFQRLLIVKNIKELAGEEFDYNEFLEKDVPLDPVRDIPTKALSVDLQNIPVRPMLPPPVLVDPLPHCHLHHAVAAKGKKAAIGNDKMVQ